jgi:hypothetical protein
MGRSWNVSRYPQKSSVMFAKRSFECRLGRRKRTRHTSPLTLRCTLSEAPEPLQWGHSRPSCHSKSHLDRNDQLRSAARIAFGFPPARLRFSAVEERPHRQIYAPPSPNCRRVQSFVSRYYDWLPQAPEHAVPLRIVRRPASASSVNAQNERKSLNAPPSCRVRGVRNQSNALALDH